MSPTLPHLQTRKNPKKLRESRPDQLSEEKNSKGVKSRLGFGSLEERVAITERIEAAFGAKNAENKLRTDSHHWKFNDLPLGDPRDEPFFTDIEDKDTKRLRGETCNIL